MEQKEKLSRGWSTNENETKSDTVGILIVLCINSINYTEQYLIPAVHVIPYVLSRKAIGLATGSTDTDKLTKTECTD